MQKEKTKISGYFVVFANEAKELERKNRIRGRLGVFYQKDELIQKLKSHPTLDQKRIYIAQISVPKEAIFYTKDEKFGFRSKKNVYVTLETFVFEKATAVA
jgi:hypothetical protein